LIALSSFSQTDTVKIVPNNDTVKVDLKTGKKIVKDLIRKDYLEEETKLLKADTSNLRNQVRLYQQMNAVNERKDTAVAKIFSKYDLLIDKMQLGIDQRDKRISRLSTGNKILGAIVIALVSVLTGVLIK
jgi:hypothetical protein